jgi:hypothetical protein
METIQPHEIRRFTGTSVGCADYLCWTRMQTEAGQALESIVARKEIERQAGDGLFLWGVGNAPSRTIRPLALRGTSVPVIFSVMRTKPRPVDCAPGRVVVWRRYIDKDGIVRPLPGHCIVTSRGDSPKGPKRTHFALMCRSGEPLELRSGVTFHPGEYRNAGTTGAPVGASQVTALLQRTRPSGVKGGYEANMTAELAGSYWVRLSDPKELSESARRLMKQAEGMSPEDWLDLAFDLRRDARVSVQPGAMPMLV